MLGFRLVCRTDYRLVLSQDQKQTYKLLLSLKLKEKSAFPNPLKGFAGMLTAHRVLLEKGAAGILIGGLSEAVWNRKLRSEKLDEHKDVDVLVPSYSGYSGFALEEPFEAGIDWWVPRTERVTVYEDGSSVEGNQTWYENGNGVKLNFGIDLEKDLPPGLHLLPPDLVTKMRLCEARASVNLDVDGDVKELFEQRVSRRMKTMLPRFVREGGFHPVNVQALRIVELSHGLVLALQKI